MTGLIYQIARPITKQTGQEAAVAGRVADATIGALLTATKTNIIPENVRKSAVGIIPDALEGYGGYQAMALAFYGVQAAAVSGPALPIALTALGSYQVGIAFNNLYQRFSGQSLGADIYDWSHRSKSNCK